MCNIKYITEGLSYVCMSFTYAYMAVQIMFLLWYVCILSACRVNVINVVCIFCQTDSRRCGGKV